MEMGMVVCAIEKHSGRGITGPFSTSSRLQLSRGVSTSVRGASGHDGMALLIE